MRRSIGSGLVKGSRDFNIFFPLHPLGFWRLGGPSASRNISSSWCLVTPLPCYFPSLGIEGAHGSSESPENTAFLSSWEQCLFPGTFHPGYIRGKEPPSPHHLLLPAFAIDHQLFIEKSCFYTAHKRLFYRGRM